MSNMSALIDVFRMDEIEKKTRSSLIIRLGIAINNEMGGNYTEPLVYELVKLLDPDNEILENQFYKPRANDDEVPF